MASLGSIQWHASSSPLSTRSCPELGYVITIVPSWLSRGTFRLCGGWGLFHSIRITHVSFTHTNTHTHTAFTLWTLPILHCCKPSCTWYFVLDRALSWWSLHFLFPQTILSVGRVVEWCILLTTGPGQCWSLFEVRWGGHRSRGWPCLLMPRPEFFLHHWHPCCGPWTDNPWTLL